jgi:hypothetical protein
MITINHPMSHYYTHVKVGIPRARSAGGRRPDSGLGIKLVVGVVTGRVLEVNE